MSISQCEKFNMYTTSLLPLVLCYFVLLPLSISLNFCLASFSLFQFRRKCFLAGSFVLGKKYSGGINNLSRSEYKIQRRVQGKLIIRSCWHSQKTIHIRWRWAPFFALSLWRDEFSVTITKQDLVIVCKLRITLSGDNFRVICLSIHSTFTCKVSGK